MLLNRVSLRAGEPEACRRAILDGLYRAMRETFDAPEDDQFMVVTAHDVADFHFGATYLGVARSKDLVPIQLTVSNTRTVERKQALLNRIAELPAENPRPRPQDVFVNLVEAAKENWSFGDGLAQYA